MKFEVLYRIVIAWSCVAEIYMLMDFCRAFHAYRTFFQKACRRYCFAAVMILLCIAVNFADNSSLNMILVPIIWLGVLVLGYRGSVLSWLKDWLLAALVMFGSEFVFLMLFSISVKTPTDEAYADEFVLICSAVGAKMVSFLVFSVLKQIPKSSAGRIELGMFLAYITMPIATLGLMLCLPYVRRESPQMDVADVVLIALFILSFVGNVLLFLFFQRYTEGRERQLLQQTQLARYEEKEQRYREVDELNRRHAVFIHNMNHYLRQIGAYAADNASKEILATLEELRVEFFTNERQVLCSNGLLNSILTEFQQRAKEKGVQTDLFVECGFKIEFIRRIDLAALFGNLLDNALEAAQQCEEGKVQVKLFMQNDGAFSVVRIQNSYTGVLVRDGEDLVSTKRDGGEHGIGLRNVREIAERYGGFLKSSFDGQMYAAVLMFPAEREEEAP